MCDLIAILAMSDEFEVEIAEYQYRNESNTLTVILPGYTYLLTDHQIGGRATLPFFSTISDIAMADRDALKYHCQSFFVVHPFIGIRNHDHLSYYSSPTVQLLSSSDELAHDVRLWDLRAVNADGKKRIHRRLRDPCDTFL
jgi:hypothetical protein